MSRQYRWPDHWWWSWWTTEGCRPSSGILQCADKSFDVWLIEQRLCSCFSLFFITLPTSIAFVFFLLQVIIGSFFVDSKKDVSFSGKGDSCGAKLPSPVGASLSGVGFLSTVDSIGRNPVREADDHHNQTMGGNHFMIQPRGLQMTPPEWGGSPDGRGAIGYDLTGRLTPSEREREIDRMF